MRLSGVLAGVLVAAAMLAGCGASASDSAVPPERKAAVAEHYADIVYAAYGASIASADMLRSAVDRLLDSPDQARLASARKAWLSARDDYVVTEPFRFYGGPIDGATTVSPGWQKVELLLWGQDRSKTGPGARARATSLRVTANRLVDDLRSVRSAWAPQGGAFRTTFLADPGTALADILRGVGALNMRTAAWMAAALKSGHVRDEQSRLSDNTNADVVNALKGIRLVYRGEFAGVDGGASLDSLVATLVPGLAREIHAELDATLTDAERFPATFERMIAAPEGSSRRTALADVIDSISAQGADLATAAKELGVKVGFAG